jgi:hypothetical protein
MCHVQILTMGWATFWAIFTQTHLVTLLLTEHYLHIVQVLCKYQSRTAGRHNIYKINHHFYGIIISETIDRLRFGANILFKTKSNF